MDFPETASPAPRRAVRTILAVDDSRTALGVVGRRLSHLGYLTVLCDSGAEAMDLIAARGFDLVLLDMVMPRMSGMQVLRAIRSGAETMDLPVIMLTGRSDPAAAVEALAAGADDHVAKPVDFDILSARIERTLARMRRIADLKKSNAALDARIAERAMELGEARAELAAARVDRTRLIASIAALNDQVERLGA
ncbi:response regulator [Sphingomonas immobilis]|uniref:Response regulator n=1 Tax=Sphingomonas immobilis TaxID=3063997 RepID=A0ABT8ZV86_9SPHN|nr:response regulator [Sphingomonas sp. CA1-15]MDO7841471.1 response regulator [Sphingomonas sp. CA1-15]